MPPPEPNKKIDDLLKAYSRKRREQAEPGFELHPVSRKALLQEVGRTFAETDSKTPARWRWSEWWRWLAVGGVMVWVLILCLYIQMPATSPLEQSLPNSLSPPVLKSVQMPAAKHVDLPNSAIASDAAGHGISPPPAAAAPAPIAAPAQPPTVVASPSASEALSVLDGLQRDRAKDVVSLGLGGRKKDQAEEKKAMAEAPRGATLLGTLKQPAEGAAISGAVQSESRRGRQFVQFDNRAQYRENLLSPPVPKVLTAFELERTGNKVRITDADGSVYEGEVVQPPRARLAKAAEDKSAAVDGITTKSGTNAGDNYSFQVSGLNRNLKLKIVFTGHVGETAVVNGENAAFGSAAAAGSVQAPVAQAAIQNSFQNQSSPQNQQSLRNQQTTQNQRSLQNQQSMPNISCEGSVQVGKGSEFQIEATPVP